MSDLTMLQQPVWYAPPDPGQFVRDGNDHQIAAALLSKLLILLPRTRSFAVDGTLQAKFQQLPPKGVLRPCPRFWRTTVLLDVLRSLLRQRRYVVHRFASAC